MSHNYNLRSQRTVSTRYAQEFVTYTRRRSNTWELEMPKTHIRTNSLENTHNPTNIRLSETMDTRIRHSDCPNTEMEVVRTSSPSNQLGNPILELLNQLNNKLEVMGSDMKVMGEHNLTLNNKLEVMGSNMDRKLEVMSSGLNHVKREVNSKLDGIQEGLQGLSLRLSSFESETETELQNLKSHLETDRNLCAKNNSALSQKLEQGLSQTNKQILQLHTHLDTQILEVSHKHTELQTEIHNTARTCEEKISQVSDDVSIQLDQIKHNIQETRQQLTDKLKLTENNNTSQPTPIIVQCANSNGQISRLPIFRGESLYAIEYLEKLNTYIRRYYLETNNNMTLHEILAESLTHEALSWFNMCRNKISNIDDFNRIFQNKYWGDSIQREVRRCLEFERYNPNCKKDRCAYFIEKVNIMRRLSPPMSDEVIVKHLMEHFGETIRVACRVQGISTVEQMEQLLTEADNDSKFNGVRRQQMPVIPTHYFNNTRQQNTTFRQPINSYNSANTRYDNRNNRQNDTQARHNNYRPYQDVRLQTQPYPMQNRFHDSNQGQTNNQRPNQYHHYNDRPNNNSQGYRQFNNGNRPMSSNNTHLPTNSPRPYNNPRQNNTGHQNTPTQNRTNERQLQCNYLERTPVTTTQNENTDQSNHLNGTTLS